jgi:hypothetical protein
MANRSLLDDLTRTLGDIDALAERHAAAHDTAATQERLAFLHQRLQTLHQDLLALRASAAHVAGGAALLAETHALLRSWEPKTLRSPAQALGHAHLDLLSLVEYTGAAITLVRERRTMLERSLANAGGANGITAAQEDSQVRAVGDNNCADPAD